MMPSNQRDLDFDQPAINIGSHSDNDIVLTGEGVRPFHVSLILQDGECQILSLEPDSDVRLDGKLIETAQFRLAAGAHRLTIAGNTLLLEHNKVFDGLHVRIIHNAVSNDDREQPQTSAVPVVATTTNPISEKAIVATLISQTDEIEVGQTATCQLRIVNAGPLVASFKVTVEGVPAEWVSITPEEINLYEGQHEQVYLNIIPPRQYDSTAGLHNLKISVSSPNYPGHQVIVPASLRIKPYYEFSLGNLSPREQNVPWGKRIGHTSLPIKNMGNCPADFIVSAVDDENNCSFDFVLQDGVRLNRQATLHIPAGQILPFPIEITPHKRPIFVRNKRYPFTANAQVTNQPGAPQMVSGSVTAYPLFPWWILLLGVLATLVLTFIIVQPYIYSFDVVADKDVIELTDSTTLKWSVSPFASQVNISNIPQPLTSGQTSLLITPSQSTTYELVAGNWVSGLFKMDQRQSHTVLVMPPTPSIKAFTVDNTSVAQGKKVTVRWSITEADQAFLTAGDVVYELPKEQFSGEKDVLLDKDGLVTLDAKNATGHDLRSYFVNVVPPKITITNFSVWVSTPDTDSTSGQVGITKLAAPSKASPDPNFPYPYVELVPDASSANGYRPQFDQKRELAKGEQVLVVWDVAGTDNKKVQIAPFTDALPDRGSQPSFPTESMNFVLTAKSGELENIYMLPVKVFNGQPPTAPTINFFQAVPKSSTGPVDVVFSWSVSGTWDHIQIGSSSKPKIADVDPLGSMKIKVSESGTYILTAWNGKLSSAMPLDITINPELLAPGLSVTNVSPITDQYLIGNKITVTTKFSTNHKPSPTGTVTVTDGLSTCSITLPAVSCDLIFKSAGDKKVWASYDGDTIYAQSTSAKYPEKSYLHVISPTVVLTPYFYLTQKGNPIVVTDQKFTIDQPLYITIKVTPSGGVLPDDGKSEIRMRVCKPNDCSDPIATTVTVANGVGTANMQISKFPGAGIYDLRFDYSHYDGLLAPAQLVVRNVQVLQMGVYLTLPPSADCLNPITEGKTCSISGNLSNPAQTDVLFYFHQTVGGDYLDSSMPEPGNNLFHLSEGSTKYICNVIRKPLILNKESRVVYALKCTVDVLNKAILTVKYTYDNNKIEPYYMGDPTNKSFTVDPFYLRPTSPTTISFRSANYSVGQIIPLTPHGSLGLSSNKNPITNVTGKITITSASNTDGLFGVVPNLGSTCQVNTGGSIISDVDIDEPCQIYFRKAGPWTLHFVFSGDNNYGSASADYSIVVKAQDKPSLTWEYLPKGGNYMSWQDIAQIQDNTVPVRIVFDLPSGDSNKVFEGVQLWDSTHKLFLTSKDPANSCVLKQPNPPVILYQNQQAFYDFAVNCPKGVLGAKVTLTLQFSSLTPNFIGPDSTRQILFSDFANNNVGGVYFELLPRTKGLPPFIFDWRSQIPSKNIPLLYAGETYTIHLMYQPILIYTPNLGTVNCTGPCIDLNDVLDFIKIDRATKIPRKINIQFPSSWATRMSVSGGGCIMDANNLVVLSLSTRDYATTGVPSENNWHYVELSSPAMQSNYPDYSFTTTSLICNVTFNYSTESLGSNPKLDAGSSTTFLLDSNFKEPTTSFPYSDDTYTVAGLTKARIKATITQTAPLERTMTLKNLDTAILPLTDNNVSNWFELGYPSCISSVTGTITLPSTVTWQIIPLTPGQSCTGTLSIYYKENTYFPRTLLLSESISIP